MQHGFAPAHAGCPPARRIITSAPAPVLFILALGLAAVACAPAAAAAPAPAAAVAGPSAEIEALTWVEVRDRVAAGSTTILVPIGGTEQNGPHMVLGKHNVRARFLANAIAARLGNALVAPVMAYVPEGAIHPPAAHMRYSGTLSIPDAAFEAVLEASARSFRQHGFCHVVFLGDHGGYQDSEKKVAARLNREWKADPACRVHALDAYYQASAGSFAASLRRQGFSDAEIGTHAGLADTALALAVDPALVRPGELAKARAKGAPDGVSGDPRRATRALGQPGINQIVNDSVAAIVALTGARAAPPAPSNRAPAAPK